MSPFIARVVLSKAASLHELQTVYGPQDLYDLLEIIAVDNANQYLASKRE